MPSSVTPILHWLGAQGTALLATVKDVAANSPQPARQTLISTIVLIFVAWVVLKATGKAKG
jgi:uncharacterized membrane protein